MSLIGAVPRAEGRLLNISGEVSVDYRLISGSGTDFSSLRETVRAGTGGELFREAIGRYRLQMSFFNQDQERAGSEDNLQVLDFLASLDLFPQKAPLSLSAQRVTQETEADGGGPVSGSETTITTYNLAWVPPRIWKLPQLRLHLFYHIVETDSCTPQPCDNTSRTFGGSVSASDQYPFRYVMKNTELNFSLSFASAQEVEGGDTDVQVSGRATADTQWTSAVTSNLRAGYTTGLSRSTPDIPGGIASSTAIGGTLFYRPSLKLNSSLGYDHSKDTYDRHVMSADAFYRPSPAFDINGTVRAHSIDLNTSRILSVFGSGLVVYRPIMNLTTTFSGTLGGTQASAAAGDTRTFFQNYGVGAAYFKVYELVRVNTNAGMNLGHTMGTNSDGNQTFSSNWSAQATNTKTQYVTLNGQYSGYYNTQSGGTGAEQWTNTLRADASSSYFRELLLRGDGLTLHAGVANTFFNSDVDSYQILNIVTDALYGWRNATVSAGSVMQVTTRPAEDYLSYFSEVRWVLAGWRRLTANMGARYDEQLFAEGAQTDIRRMGADANLAYQLGRVQLSLQYQYSLTDQTSTTVSHNFFARLSRRFSF